MKLKRFAAISMVCALAAGLLTGCGEKKDAAAGGSGVTELEFFSSKMENVSTMQSLVDKFNAANPDIKVTLNSPADAGTVLKTRMTKDDLPDIIAYGGDNTYTELTAAGILMDLGAEAFMKPLNPSYLQMVYDINSKGEEIAYGVPFATNASGIIYNKDLFEKAGVAIPKTWDAFMTVCQTLQDAGIQPLELTFKDGWTILPSWNALAPALQPDTFLADKKAGKATFTGTHEAVLQQYLQVVQYAQKDYMGTSYDDGNRIFANGGAAMTINGCWTIPEIKKTNADLNVDMFAYPASNDESKNNVVSGIDVMLTITTQCKNTDAAKKFITFLLQPENSQQYINEQFVFSPLEGVLQKDPTVAGLAQNIADGKVTDFVDHYYPSGFDLTAILSGFFLNKSSSMDDTQNIAETLKKCDEQYDILNIN